MRGAVVLTSFRKLRLGRHALFQSVALIHSGLLQHLQPRFSFVLVIICCVNLMSSIPPIPSGHFLSAPCILLQATTPLRSAHIEMCTQTPRTHTHVHKHIPPCSFCSASSLAANYSIVSKTKQCIISSISSISSRGALWSSVELCEAL